jgi:ATP-dependent DNA helicase RecG
MGQLDDRTLKILLGDLESDRVERKESLADKKKIRQAICAFANDMAGHGKPGVLFVGAQDDGSCAELEVTDRLLTELASMRDDGNIQPLPSMTVEKRTIEGCEMAVVVVQPSQAPPVRFQGRTWIRVGPRRAVATPEEERRLAEKRRAGDLPFDVRPVVTATLDDLDLDLFERTYLPSAVAPDVLEQNERSLDDQLRSLRLLDRSGCPTVLGMLVLGKDPRSFVPGAYAQFVRFEGTELGDTIRDQKEINAPLPELLRRIEEVLEAHNEVATSITGGPVEIRRPSYPMAALQQLVRNAVLHRSYESSHAPIRCYWFEDRIEIHNPGGPYGQVTPENFGQPNVTDYRNPHLAEAMRALGYVQRFGVGISIARRELAQNGNPPLEFDVQPTFILATARKRP